MCVACEMGFWDMIEALPPETRERILREEAARLGVAFECDAPDDRPAIQEDSKP